MNRLRLQSYYIFFEISSFSKYLFINNQNKISQNKLQKPHYQVLKEWSFIKKERKKEIDMLV